MTRTRTDWTPGIHGGKLKPWKRDDGGRNRRTTSELIVSLEERPDEASVDEVVLYRALERAGYRPVEPDGDGDERERVVDFRVVYETGGKKHTLEPDRDGPASAEPLRRNGRLHDPDHIWVEVIWKDQNGEHKTMTVPVEFAILDPEERSIEDAGLVTSPVPGASTEIERLKDLIEHAVFDPWTNDDNESVAADRTRFRRASDYILADGLLERSEALYRMAQREYAERVGIGLRPGESIEVRIHADGEKTQIEVKTDVPKNHPAG